MDDQTLGFALAAFSCMLDGNAEACEHWLLKVERAKRGEVKIALDDMEMLLSRLGPRANV